MAISKGDGEAKRGAWGNPIRVRLRSTEAWHRWVERAARSRGQSVTEFVAESIERAAELVTGEQPPPRR